MRYPVTQLPFVGFCAGRHGSPNSFKWHALCKPPLKSKTKTVLSSNAISAPCCPEARRSRVGRSSRPRTWGGARPSASRLLRKGSGGPQVPQECSERGTRRSPVPAKPGFAQVLTLGRSEQQWMRHRPGRQPDGDGGAGGGGRRPQAGALFLKEGHKRTRTRARPWCASVVGVVPGEGVLHK